MDCYERHQGKLSMVWAEQNRPTPDQFAAHAAAMNACLESKGISLTPSLEDLDEEGREAYLGCLIEVPALGAPSNP